MKQPPWWIRLIARVVRSEVDKGHLRVTRSLTYHECLAVGCSQAEALDYVTESHRFPIVTSWRGHEIMRTDIKRDAVAGMKTPAVGEEFSIAKSD